MKHSNKCIGCKKTLKKGDFVVMNGGALVGTKTGATMGDKNHMGFLSVQNHFDSKKNYQTLSIVDNGPNGQFEFYACSHKCLADFLSRQVMLLEKMCEIKKIVMAPQTKLGKIGYEWGQKVVKLLGYKGALITDESTVEDFLVTGSRLLDPYIKKLSKKFGFPIKASDYIWQLAKKLKYGNHHEPAKK